MSERLRHQGRLMEAELAAKTAKLRIEAMINSLREILDPFEAPEKIEAEKAATLAVDLSRLVIEYRAALEEIATLKRALGMH